MTGNLPAWDDNEAMFEWVDRILTDEDEAAIKGNALTDAKLRAALAQRHPDTADIEAAWKGDIGPLRRKFPHLAPFLGLPSKRKRNARLKAYLPDPTPADMVASDVVRIKALWRQYYGRVNRKRGLITAAEIAVRRYGLDPSAIDQYEHPSGPKK